VPAEETNERYLSLALEWLRLRLEEFGRRELSSAPITMPAPGSAATAVSEHRRRWRRRERAAEEGPRALPAGPIRRSDDLLGGLAEAETWEPPPALVLLGRQFGLSLFERSVLLLSAAVELDTRIPALCARAQDDAAAPYPTFALALAMFDDASWDAISPLGALRYWRLVEVHQHGDQPVTTSPLRADERIINFLKGLNQMDERLSVLVRLLDTDQEPARVPRSQEEDARRVVQRVRQVVHAPRLPVIQLVGPDQPSKEAFASAVCAELGLVPYVLSSELLPQAVSELESLGRLWERETRLAPVALCLDVFEADPAGRDGQPSPVNRFLSRTDAVAILDTRDVWPGLSRATVVVDVAKPTAVEQQAAWEAAVGDRAQGAPPLLAGQFDLSLAAIEEVAQEAGEVEDDEHTLHTRLWEGCLAASRPRLDALAERLEPMATWNDIVLPEQELALLWELASQVEQRSQVYDQWGFRRRMNRGLGISALFAGESGTGKTMAAEVLANHLRLNLYRIDLSAVVSKYIGETEKNLRRLFDAAEDGGAILFFDEADALFGKRSEVKDSHDRYANIEINYLLQRMEAYGGLAILGTNMKDALDQAFLRRLRFILRCPFPTAQQRRAIWERAFPAETPTDGLDFEFLARLNLTGGSVQSIALNAAFLAAGRRAPVTMELILGAARTEFRKLDRPVNENELSWAPPAPAPVAVAVEVEG
jgi:SpoVK/Ycf46/Vps4 family AAA+-type ATPase